MARRFRGEVNDEVANVAPGDMARLARRLAGFARSLASEDTFGVAPIALSDATGYLGVLAGAVVRAIGSSILDTQGRVQCLVSFNTH
eukprot:15063796-Alexandrium_andersonii.AAC.1